MKYDFTTIMDRSGHDAIAVDVIPIPGAEVREGFSKIPMWVADMNFPTLPTILEAVEARLQHHHFGYFMLPDEYFDSIIRWHETRYGTQGLKKEHIDYENGVLGCVASAVQAFTAPGEAILLHSPTYIGFTGTINNNGRKIILSDLVQDENNVWRMDYEDMEEKIRENHIHCAIFCSPHNPSGRVWERWEIEKAMEVYKKYDCVVISDEIWADIVLPGAKHVPTQSVSEDARNRTIAVYAPSKTFNLAGLVGSYHVIYNKYLRDRVSKVSSMSHYNSSNVLSVHALIGAYRPEGYEWVDELCQVLGSNVDYAYDYITGHFKGVKLSKPQGTYMLYLDCEEWCREHKKSLDDLLAAGVSVGVVWQDGRPFNRPYTIRMNLAVPHVLVKEAMSRLDQYVFNPEHEEEDDRLKVGDKIPNFVVETPFEKQLGMNGVLDRKTALVFLRYYGCTLCQLDLHDYAKEYDKIRRTGGKLVVVLQSDPQKLADELGSKDAFPFEILCDPEGKLYQALDIRPAHSRQGMAGANTMEKIARAKEEGYEHGAYEGNELQLPAAFVVDDSRTVVYAHYARTVDDVPSARELARVMRSI